MNVGLVSAIIIVYNDERFVARAIESALNQTYENLEIIVVDDGSKDKSFEIAKSFLDRGIQVFRKENGGAASARNFGAKHATGEYLAFLDSDDVWMPERIEKMFRAGSGIDEPCIVYSGYHFVDEHLKPIMRPFMAMETSPYRELLHCRNQMLPSTMIMHRQVFDTLTGFPEDQQMRVYEDGVFTLLVARRFKAIPVREPLTLYLYSSSGLGRSAVFDYELSINLQRRVFSYVKTVLNENEFCVFQNAAWINNFYKFAMHGQLCSARRLKKETGIKAGEMLRSVRGILALLSVYSRLNILCFCKNVYHGLYRKTHRVLKI